MGKPCEHPRYVKGCRVCYWCRSRTKKGIAYRELWGVPLDESPIRQTIETRSRGEASPLQAALVKCGGCPGNVRIKVHEKMPLEAMVKLLRTTIPDEEWPRGYEAWEVTKRARAIVNEEPSQSASQDGSS